MIKNLVLIGIIYFGYRMAKKMILNNGGLQGNKSSENKNDDIMIQDPQCKVYFHKNEGVPLILRGQTLFFCSEKCKNAYKKKHT